MASSKDELLKINSDVTLTVLPAIVFIGILMVAGLLGNPLVIYYYGFKLISKPANIFIVALASFDVLVCGVSMPLEILDLIKFYTFDSVVACKLFRFVNYFAGISSILILILISADRYKKICRPFGNQITDRTARVSVGVITVSSISVSWPVAFFFSSIPVNITREFNETATYAVIGCDCTNVRDAEYRLYITIYNGLSFLVFLIIVITLFVLYYLIGRQMCRQRRFERTFEVTNGDHSQTKMQTTNSTSLRTGNNTEVSRDERDVQMISTISYNKRERFSIQGTNKEYKRNASQFKRRNIIKLRKFTMTMLCISVTFVLSFLPYLGLLTWRIIKGGYEPNHLSKTQLVFFQIFVRSFLINSVSNPFIYGFFCDDFRHFFCGIVCRMCCNRRKVKSHSDGHNSER